MEAFTPISGLIGGLLIGAAAALLLAAEGRVAGISGIVGSLLEGPRGDWGWRVQFVLGLLVGGAIWQFASPGGLDIELQAGPVTMVAAGLLVGFGSRLGSGCTSGHGVCGIARLSVRSLVATGVFMGAAAVTVFVTRHLVGG